MNGSRNVLKILTAEFQRVGVKFDTRVTGRTHIKLSWQVSPDKERRCYFIPTTSGDGRGWRNARAGVRRMLRADGIGQQK
jgi:hypothetical protein